MTKAKTKTRGGSELTEFGRWIDRRIKELQVQDPTFTRERLASLAGISRQHLWRGMKGGAEFTVFEVAQLARNLRLNPDSAHEAYWKGRDPKWTAMSLGRRLREIGGFAEHLYGHPALSLPSDPLGGNVRESMYSYNAAALPRELQISATEFRLEAMRRGADDRELTFIDSVLSSPEAIFRQSGFRGQDLTPDQQQSELEGVIAMLRAWLDRHIQRRDATAGGGKRE